MSDSTSGGAVSSGAISIGGVFSRTFASLFSNFVTFLIISFLILLPLPIFNLLAGGGMASPPQAIGVGYLIAVLINMVLTYAAMGAVVYGTVAYLRGNPAGLGECLSRGFAAVVPVILVAILITIMGAIGMMLLIIPGIIVFVITAAAVPAAVVERPGIWGSIKRSAELTKGNRWRIFALLVIFYIVMMGIAWVLGLAGLPVLVPDGSIFAIIVLYVWSGVTTAFFAVFGAVIYHDLRVAKEGVSSEQIAAVFD
ncbi:hypothetical protein [Pelagibius marinus]|uniref:hypothetical protein n=1 Tax=Pelagibius marinus TaxID=2762760 RepID=UPI00187219FC|nr:hypothetical protein [Pelagibius marinus]